MAKLNSDYKNYNRTFEKDSEDVLKSSVIVEVDELDVMLQDGDGLHRHRDVWLLSNTQRIAKDALLNSPTNLRSLLDRRLFQKGASFDDTGLTDEDIASSIKSRRIQSVTDITSFINELGDRLSNIRNRAILFSKDAEEKINPSVTSSNSE